MAADSASFPGPGSLPWKLCKILSPQLTNYEMESIALCLFAHLLVENSLNELLYRWLKLDAPTGKDKVSTDEAGEQLWKNIVKMDFAKKYSLLEPFFILHFPNEAKNPWKINNLRNDIFHGKATIKEAKFNGMPISDERTIEAIFIAAQSTSRAVDKFDEILRSPHEYAASWRKRLEHLGESLY